MQPEQLNLLQIDPPQSGEASQARSFTDQIAARVPYKDPQENLKSMESVAGIDVFRILGFAMRRRAEETDHETLQF